MRTLERLFAMFLRNSRSSAILASQVTIRRCAARAAPSGSGVSPWVASASSPRSRTFLTTTSRSSREKGFMMKSAAPCFMASTAVFTVP